MKKFLSILSAATIFGVIGGYFGSQLSSSTDHQEIIIQDSNASPVQFERTAAIVHSTDFSTAAERTVHHVVHVKTSVEQGYYFNPLRDFFFGFGDEPQMQPRIVQGSGSGVIVSEDGYIVTNNHVIDRAQEVTVTLNDNREYSAEIIGVDPTTDLAVLKIDAEGLSRISFANSDDVRLGEWVLAVGNPFNLTSSVTAGIISAKGRNINIIDNNSAIEAFIQTDAAVNPGNSGGALVNTSGELIGINTAISSRSGSYEGYSFAIPSSIVRKILDDIVRHGVVQRAYLGVSINDITPALKEDFEIEENQGVYIAGISPEGAAKKAGIKKGDVIVRANGRDITKSSELLEVIGSKRPGDKVDVLVMRDGKQKKFNVLLRNRAGTTDVLKAEEVENLLTLGAQMEALEGQELMRYRIRNGVRVIDTGSGKLKEAGVPKGFIIVKINNQAVQSIEAIAELLEQLQPGDGVLIQGLTKEGEAKVFAFAL